MEIDPTKEMADVLEKPVERTGTQGQGTVATHAGNELTEVQTNLAVVDTAIEEIGFGNFQWQLTFSCAFGFLVDQLVLVSISLVTPQSAMEFGPKYPTLLSAALYAGLLVGAVVLGGLADNIGRKLVWHASIFGVSAVAMCAAASPNWAALNVFEALIGFFAGGNLAIDLTMLAESIPRRWSFILSGLASIWGLGNAITGLIAWPLLVNYGCPGGSTPEDCSRGENMGWRYLYITVGGLCLVMALVRAIVLRSLESPRWLVTSGRVEEAVNVLNSISSANRAQHRVHIDMFIPTGHTAKEQVSLSENARRAARLFTGKQKLRLMGCLLGIWLMIGIAYPLYTIFLPYYLAAHGANLGESSNYITYRDWAISSVVGIFGPFISMAMMATPMLRSRKTLVITGIACTAFSGAFTTVKTAGQNLAFSCMVNFWLNALYAVIYSYTPLALDVENRGLGNGLLVGCSRLASLTAPFIATFADVTTSAPIWVSCGCYMVIGILAMLLPFDTAAF